MNRLIFFRKGRLCVTGLRLKESDTEEIHQGHIDTGLISYAHIIDLFVCLIWA